uniref:T9SS type A sorting domain-containing protein n=1 Tax=Roseivirga sp. TaxID=1964215 RepID=UPI004047C285
MQCNWHHQWVWELPVGWKVTSVGGNMATATNVYQGSKTVQIKAPAILSNATLNVRSENAWPYPVNTQTQIITGVASAPEEISYNFMLEFPEEICYPTAFGNLGDFIASAPLSGANSVAYYEWQSDAGIVQNPSSTYPSTSVQFNNPGYRYIRVRSVNFCGVPSAWRTEYFTLTYNINGCSGGGLGGFSIISSPNPATDEIDIEITDEVAKSNSNHNQDKKYYRYMIFDMNQDLIYDKQSKSPRHNINTRSLKSGRYILRVITPDGSKTQHLIIDRDKKD